MASDVGLIVGSGLRYLGLEIAARSPLKTPFGEPSSPVLTVVVAQRRLPCVARHGELHGIAPHDVNYRANLWALHQHGVRRCVALNVVGAIEAGFEPGDLAVPHQLIDYTWGRASTFGQAAGAPLHVELTHPFDATLRASMESAAVDCGLAVRRGVYGVAQGPRLETAAEIDRMDRDGCTMVGMTAMPEAALARELGIAYAICAVAVNRAAGRAGDASPIHAQVEQSLRTGMAHAGKLLARLIDLLHGG